MPRLDSLVALLGRFGLISKWEKEHFKIILFQLMRLKKYLLQNNIPPEVIAQSGEFELALATLIIMLSPIAPHFCCELWAGLQSAPNRICNNSLLINWENNVLHQKWPVVDEHYELSFRCKVSGKLFG